MQASGPAFGGAAMVSMVYLLLLVFPLQHEFEILIQAVAVPAFQERVADLLDQAQASPVPDDRHERVDGPVQDREAEADERDILGPGNVLAIRCADQEIDRLLLDPLLEFEEVAFRFDLAARDPRLFEHLLDLGLERLPGVPVRTYFGTMPIVSRNSVSAMTWSGSPKIATRLSLVVEVRVDQRVNDLPALDA